MPNLHSIEEMISTFTAFKCSAPEMTQRPHHREIEISPHFGSCICHELHFEILVNRSFHLLVYARNAGSNTEVFSIVGRVTMTESIPPPRPPSPRQDRAGELSSWYKIRNGVTEMFAKRELQRKQRRRGTHHLIAGTTAGVVTTTALYPLDLVKTRYQVR